MELWGSLIGLAVGSALVPVHIVITILLLRSSVGKVAAVAWVAGLTTVRLAQGIVFGLVLGSREAQATSGGLSLIVSALLLVISIVFFIAAGKQWLHEPDEDFPPPKWMAIFEGVTPGRAYLLGIGLLAIGAKFWVFTLGAIAAIGAAGLGQAGAIVTFLVWIVLAESVHLTLVAMAYLRPAQADAALTRLSALLERYNRVIVITLGLVFGTWFLIKALSGLGVI